MINLIIIDGVECYEENDTAYLKLETVARGLGFTEEKDGKTYIRWRTVKEYLEEFGFSQEVAKRYRFYFLENSTMFTEWAKTAFIPENVFYRLAMKAKNEVAEAFQAKIADEIIPQIRRTGRYNAYEKIDDKTSEAALMTARVAMSDQYLKIADATTTLSTKYRDVLIAKAAEALAGEMILPLPKQERRTYSAKEVGERMGVSANKIGRIANANSLKVPEYGEYYRSKSEYSNREVDTWRYYESVFPVIKEILESE